MYNPSRGGVRGGADQFSWDSVKNDKHRENYLGHSLKAPIGRWQKGKDLTWYDKKRNDSQDAVINDRSELEEIKKAEQEAMLIALGHNIVQKDTQRLTKEEMKEALKRNASERDALNIERIDGVGVSSARTALLMGSVKHEGSKNGGVVFENRSESTKERKLRLENLKEHSSSTKRKKSKKSSKKHKKDKKRKKHHHRSTDSEDTCASQTEVVHKSAKKQSRSSHKSSRHKHHSASENSDSDNVPSKSKEKHSKKRKLKMEDSPKRKRHDTSESD